MKQKIENLVYSFFINSRDFNGIPLRQVSSDLQIDYIESIDLIKSLVIEDIISIQSSTNPHIIGLQHYPVKTQIKILEDAKNNKVSYKKMGALTFSTENTEFPICLYPSQTYLKINRDLTKFKNSEYTKRLALGEPHLKAVFFEIEVLERYYNDPRFDFKFDDFSGAISYKYDEKGKPILRLEDQIFLKTFGLGFDKKNNKLAVAYLRYLIGLTEEHQIFWKSKEIKGECKVLEEYYQTTINGYWTFSHSIFSAFIGELNCLNSLSQEIFGKNLFLKSFDEENRPKEFTFFFTPTSKNYDEFILLLDKMISDNLNKDFFKGETELYEIEKLDNNTVERKPKGTLRIFEEWFLSKYTIDKQELLKELFAPLKKIRRERQNPAHRINENIYNKKYFEMQKQTISTAYSCMNAFRKIFQQHPKASQFNIPEWLEKGKILNF